MTNNPDTELLTIAEAAKILKVSSITLHRWLKTGRLPAYHVGPKAVRIRRADLQAVMTPVLRREVTTMKETQFTPIQTSIRPLTDAEAAAALEALAEAKAFTAAMRERRGGRRLGPSWPLIREERVRRGEQR
jgi:excisionase family DNA binding protein